MRRLLPSLLMDVILPVATFNVLNALGVQTLIAVTAGGVFPLISIARSWIKTRQIEPLGIVVLTFLVLGTAASLISGSVLFALIRGSFLTAVFGLVCLGSLLTKRTLTFYLMRQMVAAGDPAIVERWNGLWDVPSFRRTQQLVAIVWGLTYVVEAIVRVVLALTFEPAVVVNVSPVFAFAATIGLALWTRHVMLASRARREREAAQSAIHAD